MLSSGPESRPFRKPSAEPKHVLGYAEVKKRGVKHTILNTPWREGRTLTTTHRELPLFRWKGVKASTYTAGVHVFIYNQNENQNPNQNENQNENEHGLHG